MDLIENAGRHENVKSPWLIFILLTGCPTLLSPSSTMVGVCGQDQCCACPQLGFTRSELVVNHHIGVSGEFPWL